VRYYGGTNLGVGGLITAYKTAAKDALDKAVIEENFVSDYFQIRYTYNQTGEIMNLLQKTGVEIIEQKFDDKGPLIVFKISQSKSQRLKEEFDNKPNYQLTLSAS